MIRHCRNECGVRADIHRAFLRTVVHPPRAIGIEEDLIVVWTLQHRCDAERIDPSSGFVDTFDQWVNSLDTTNNRARIAKERCRANSSEVRQKSAEDSLSFD